MWKRREKGEVASAEFEQNSIPGLASSWSQALAGEGRNSPSDIVEAMKKVTVDDVNRAAKKYLTVESSIVATLKPAANGEPVAGAGFGGAEVTTAAPTKPVTLPVWAEASVKSLKVPGSSSVRDRHYPFERSAAYCPNREGQPDDHGRGFGQARGGARNSTRQGRRR